ncbi:MAG: hypothetical protein SGPRY_001243 [Prymnesium sp.]
MQAALLAAARAASRSYHSLLGPSPPSSLLLSLLLSLASCRLAIRSKLYHRIPARTARSNPKERPSTPDEAVAGLPSVESTLNFCGGTHSLTSSSSRGSSSQVKRMRIYDGRPASRRFSLEAHSFELSRAPHYDSSLVDMYDCDSVTRHFYPCVEKMLLSRITGAKRVLIFDHLLRNKARASEEIEERRRELGSDADPRELQPKTRFLELPLSNVHGDYTARSGPSRARQLLEPYCSEEQREEALGSRFALVNVWHAFGPQPVRADPLAMCVWGSFGPSDVATKRLVFPHRVGETYQGLHSPKQKWVYFSEVSRDEAILIKVFDSLDDGKSARFSLHSSFRLPEQDGPDASLLPVRESIEIRCLVLYGPGTEQLAPHFCNASLAGPGAPEKARAHAELTENEMYNLRAHKIQKANCLCKWETTSQWIHRWTRKVKRAHTVQKANCLCKWETTRQTVDPSLDKKGEAFTQDSESELSMQIGDDEPVDSSLDKKGEACTQDSESELSMQIGDDKKGEACTQDSESELHMQMGDDELVNPSLDKKDAYFWRLLVYPWKDEFVLLQQQGWSVAYWHILGKTNSFYCSNKDAVSPDTKTAHEVSTASAAPPPLLAALHTRPRAPGSRHSPRTLQPGATERATYRSARSRISAHARLCAPPTELANANALARAVARYIMIYYQRNNDKQMPHVLNNIVGECFALDDLLNQVFEYREREPGEPDAQKRKFANLETLTKMGVDCVYHMVNHLDVMKKDELALFMLNFTNIITDTVLLVANLLLLLSTYVAALGALTYALTKLVLSAPLAAQLVILEKIDIFVLRCKSGTFRDTPGAKNGTFRDTSNCDHMQPQDPAKDLAEVKTEMREGKACHREHFGSDSSDDDWEEGITERGDGYVISMQMPRDRRLYDWYKREIEHTQPYLHEMYIGVTRWSKGLYLDENAEIVDRSTLLRRWFAKRQYNQTKHYISKSGKTSVPARPMLAPCSPRTPLPAPCDTSDTQHFTHTHPTHPRERDTQSALVVPLVRLCANAHRRLVRLSFSEQSDTEQGCSDVLCLREVFAAWLSRHNLKRLHPEFIHRNCATLDTLLHLGEQKVYGMLKKFEMTSDEMTLFMLNYTICRNMVLYDHTYRTLDKLPDWLQDIQSAANAHNKINRRLSSTPRRIKRKLNTPSQRCAQRFFRSQYRLVLPPKKKTRELPSFVLKLAHNCIAHIFYGPLVFVFVVLSWAARANFVVRRRIPWVAVSVCAR